MCGEAQFIDSKMYTEAWVVPAALVHATSHERCHGLTARRDSLWRDTASNQHPLEPPSIGFWVRVTVRFRVRVTVRFRVGVLGLEMVRMV